MPDFSLPRGGRATYLLSTLMLATLAGCVITAGELVGAGAAEPARFDTVVPFLQIRDTVVIEARVNGEASRYLLDTGAHVSLLDRRTHSGEAITVSGAGPGEESMTATTENVVEIGGIRFVGTYTAGGELADLSRVIPGFGGVLGQPVLSKADWMVNFSTGELRIGSNLEPALGMTEIPVHYRSGLPHVVLTIDGRTVEALVDAGASTYLVIPDSSPTADLLRARYDFAAGERQLFTMGGTRRVALQTGTIPRLQLGDLTLNDVPVELRDTSRPRLGARFLADRGMVLLRGRGNFWVLP